MISSIEEFVLLLRKWKSSSATVGLLTKTNAFSLVPLSTSTIFSVHGVISAIDETRFFFVLSFGERDFVSVGYGEALINFSTSREVDENSELGALVATIGDLLDEVVTVTQKQGLLLTIYTLKH